MSVCLACACGSKGSVYAFEPSNRGNLIGTLNPLNDTGDWATISHVNDFVSSLDSHTGIDQFASHNGHSVSFLKIDVDGGNMMSCSAGQRHC
jgi:hypothetical protein